MNHEQKGVKQGCKDKPVMLTWATLMPQNTENLKNFPQGSGFSYLCLDYMQKKGKSNSQQKFVPKDNMHACNKASVISDNSSLDNPWMHSIDSYICFSCLKIPRKHYGQNKSLLPFLMLAFTTSMKNNSFLGKLFTLSCLDSSLACNMLASFDWA